MIKGSKLPGGVLVSACQNVLGKPIGTGNLGFAPRRMGGCTFRPASVQRRNWR